MVEYERKLLRERTINAQGDAGGEFHPGRCSFSVAPIEKGLFTEQKFLARLKQVQADYQIKKAVNG
jgi:hypothetical protein